MVCSISPIEPQEMPHRAERRPLVALLESVRLRNAGQQSDREHDDVLLAVSESILRTRQRTFEQTNVAEEMAFGSFLNFKLVLLDYRFNWQPIRLIWQGRLAIWGSEP